jgi:hypothetical protein
MDFGEGIKAADNIYSILNKQKKHRRDFLHSFENSNF